MQFINATRAARKTNKQTEPESTQRVQTSANDFHVLFLAVFTNRSSK